MGGGCYNHVSPAAVWTIFSTGEGSTSTYTPYQAELSQGTLQVIFEFQTMVAELLGTEVAEQHHNRDQVPARCPGIAEKWLLRITRLRERRSRLKGIHPEYREVAHTYNEGLATTGDRLDSLRMEQLLLACCKLLDEDTACQLFQTELHLGCLGGHPGHHGRSRRGCLLVMSEQRTGMLRIVEPPGPARTGIRRRRRGKPWAHISLGGPHCGARDT